MKTLKLSIASAIALSLAACNGAGTEGDTPADEATATEEAAATGTVVEVAQGDDQFSTLVSAVEAADLGGTLSGDGPFTVFAPTNAAFEKIDAATLETLTTTDTEKLGTILKYHVVPAEVNAAGLTAAINQATENGEDYVITTVAGTDLTAKVVDGSVVLTDATGNTATVTATDVKATNGMIHVIDTVLMPE